MAERSFGRMIEDRRRELELAQEVLAKKVGVKANYIGYLERGRRHPSQKVIERLSNALKLDPQELYLLANPRVRTLLGKGNPKRTVISTPFPSIYSTATELGMREARARRLVKLMNEIQAGRDVRRLGSLDDIPTLAPAAKAKKK